MARDLLVKVAQIKGKCPVYQVGDSFSILDGFRFVAEKPLCLHSLASLMSYYVALSRGVPPVELSLAREGEVAYLQCLDPCERTGGGTVVFAVVSERAKERRSKVQWSAVKRSKSDPEPRRVRGV